MQEKIGIQKNVVMRWWVYFDDDSLYARLPDSSSCSVDKKISS